MSILLFQPCLPYYYFFHHTLVCVGLSQRSINTNNTRVLPSGFLCEIILSKPLYTPDNGNVFQVLKKYMKMMKWKRGAGGQYLLKCLKKEGNESFKWTRGTLPINSKFVFHPRCRGSFRKVLASSRELVKIYGKVYLVRVRKVWREDL